VKNNDWYPAFVELLNGGAGSVFEPWDMPPTKRRNSFSAERILPARRRPSFARMLKQARKMGVDVVVMPDGSAVVRTAGDNSVNNVNINDVNEWDSLDVQH
jgi:hypothetical protein